MVGPAVRHRRDLRVDIEGLRAFAVLAVLAHHAWPSVFPGGFIGVDVFFVISGYLVGSHLIDGLGRGTLSIGQFYARRVRRLFPALAIVLACTWLGASFLFTPTEFSELGRHTVASVAFAVNFMLAHETGYFDAPALTKPLLHLWSLAVEEQFYIAAPLLVVAGLRGSRPAAWVVRLGVLSLAWTLTAPETQLAGSFFLLPARWWELAAGMVLGAMQLARGMPVPGRELKAWLLLLAVAAMLALLADLQQGTTSVLQLAGTGVVVLLALLALHVATPPSRPAMRPGLVQAALRAAGPAGLLVLVAAVFFVAPEHWPGAQTVWPVVGAMLVIGLPSPLMRRVLGSRPAVAVGAISYPLYLWHWPLLVGWRMLHDAHGWQAQLPPLAGAFALAWLTKSLVEDRFRFGLLGSRPVGQPALWVLPACMATVAAAGSVALATDGLPQRFPGQLRAIAQWHQDWADMASNWRIGRCFQHAGRTEPFPPECSPPKRAEASLVLLWGDSHAAHFSPALLAMASNGELDFAQWTQGSCPPTVVPLPGEGAACRTRRTADVDSLGGYRPDVLVMAGAWALHQQSGSSREQIIDAIEQTVRRARAAGVQRIVLFGDGPRWDTAFPSELFRFMAREGLTAVPRRFGHVAQEDWALDDALAQVSRDFGIGYFSVLRSMCDASGCQPVVDVKAPVPDLMYWDRDHLTASAAVKLIAQAKPLLMGAADDCRREGGTPQVSSEWGREAR